MREALSPGDLTDTERELIENSVTGATLDLRRRLNEAKTVRGRLICQILTDPISLGIHGLTGVSLRGARVTEHLNLGGRTLKAPVELHDCSLDHTLLLTKATAPNVSLKGSSVPGLKASYLHCSGTLNLGSGFRALGQVRLFGADLVHLEAEGGIFDNPNGYAINANYLRVSSYVSLERAVVRGTVTLLGAVINGQLDMTDLRASTRYGEYTLELDSASITGGVMLRSAVVDGGIWLVGLKAEGEIGLQDATITAPDRAIDASSSRIRFLDMTRATISGEVKIASAELTGFDGTDARLSSTGATSLDLDSSTISGPVHAQFASISGVLDLTNTSIGVYRDLKRSWPPSARLVGATYRKIESDIDGPDGDNSIIANRLRWLELDSVYHPHSYIVLGNAYKAVGKERTARAIAIAGEKPRWEVKSKGIGKPLTRAWSWALRALVGYGYEPLRATGWLLVMTALATALCQWMYALGLIVAVGNQRPEFVAIRFALDLLFPVAGLRDSDNFATYGLAAWIAFALTLAGWFFGIAVVTAIAAVFRRR